MSSKLIFVIILLNVVCFFIAGCISNDKKTSDDNLVEDNDFDSWWSDFKEPVVLDYSNYTAFYRGVWGSRLDEVRNILLKSDVLRNAGVDTVMMGPDVIINDSDEVVTLCDDVFIFYLQALRREGFRILLIPNPMHPNFDDGRGFEWEEPDPDVRYQRGKDLLDMFTPVVSSWASIAEAYNVEAFSTVNELNKLVWDEVNGSVWSQEILPSIRSIFSGFVGVTVTHRNVAESEWVHPCYNAEPYDYNLSGYDFLIGSPSSGWEPIDCWGLMLEHFMSVGNNILDSYSVNSSMILYEWGAYRGGIWYEPISDEFVMSDSQQYEIFNEGRNRSDMISGSFPRFGRGWLMENYSAFEVLKSWYLSRGDPIQSVDGNDWTEEKLLDIEKTLSGDLLAYELIFQV
ncbi:MAG: hypothetical protein KAW45_03195 [Thermoplasmatales archaeon]|nr:hypothetical protein [Thermoplasmatales archaeon]